MRGLSFLSVYLHCFSKVGHTTAKFQERESNVNTDKNE